MRDPCPCVKNQGLIICIYFIRYLRKFLLFFSLTHGSVPDFDEMFGHLPDNKSDNSDSDFELNVSQQMLIFLSFKQEIKKLTSLD